MSIISSRLIISVSPSVKKEKKKKINTNEGTANFLIKLRPPHNVMYIHIYIYHTHVLNFSRKLAGRLNRRTFDFEASDQIGHVGHETLYAYFHIFPRSYSGLSPLQRGEGEGVHQKWNYGWYELSPEITACNVTFQQLSGIRRVHVSIRV